MYYDGPFKTWADDLASDKPAPGGGSAAALSGVAGCALLSMVGNFTVGKKKYKDVEDEIRVILDTVEGHRSALAKLVDDDVTSYGGVTEAYAMPKDTDEQKKARSAAIQEGLKAALAVPLRTCRESHAALLHAPVLLAKGNTNLVSDVGVGAQCLACAFRSAWLNVEINLASIKDAAFVAKTRAELDPLCAEVESTLAEVWEGTVRAVQGG